MTSKVSDNTIAGDMQLVKELTKQLQIPVQVRKTWVDGCKYGMTCVESMLERAISYVGKIQGSTVDGQDFADGTDAKKVIVTLNDKATQSRCATIGNVGNKNHILRIMVADPMDGNNYYFLIPKEECTGKTTLKIPFSKNGGPPDSILKNAQSLIRAYENGKQIDYSKMEFTLKAWLKYRVHSFSELCAKVVESSK